MDASFQQPLLSFRTLLFSFIDIIFVHKTQSCYPPLQGNFISRPRLIRNSSILDLPDTLVATTAFSTFCTSLSAIDITIFAEKNSQLLYCSSYSFSNIAGIWPTFSRSIVTFSTTERQYILRLLAEFQWLASNPAVEIRKSSKSERTR